MGLLAPHPRQLAAGRNVTGIKREAVVSLSIPLTKTVGLLAPHPRQLAAGRNVKRKARLTGPAHGTHEGETRESADHHDSNAKHYALLTARFARVMPL